MTSPTGVGGWLRLLGIILVAWGPLSVGLSLAGALAAIPVRGDTLAILIVFRLGVAAFGVASGLALLDARGLALPMARISLIATAATNAFIELTPLYPSNRIPGDEWIAVGGSLLHAGAWLIYLARSRRVRNTFA